MCPRTAGPKPPLSLLTLRWSVGGGERLRTRAPFPLGSEPQMGWRRAARVLAPRDGREAAWKVSRTSTRSLRDRRPAASRIPPPPSQPNAFTSSSRGPSDWRICSRSRFLLLFTRSWPFMVGFAVTGALFTSIALSVTEDDVKKSSKSKAPAAEANEPGSRSRLLLSNSRTPGRVG